MTHVWMTWQTRSIQGIFSEGTDDAIDLFGKIQSSKLFRFGIMQILKTFTIFGGLKAYIKKQTFRQIKMLYK